MSAPAKKKMARPRLKTGRTPPSRESGIAATAGRPQRWSRVISFAIGVLLLVGATLAAIYQPPRPNPLRPATWKESLLYPIERNAFLFKRLPEITGSLNRIFVVPETQELWAVGEGGLILHSADAGQTWHQRQLTPPSTGAQPPPAQSPQRSALEWASVAEAGDKPAPKKEPKPAAQVLTYTPAPTIAPKLVIRGREVVPFTPNTSTLNPRTVDLRDVFFSDAQHGWVVGDAGGIFASRDGGDTWSAQTSGTDERLNSVTILPDGQHGWAVGSRGTILATRDGGATWTPQSSDTLAPLVAVTFLSDGQHGWAVGINGHILATVDGGATWTPQGRATNQWLSSVTILPDGQRGWAVGFTGDILATDDGGATWTAQSSGTTARLNSVTILPDRQHGWAVGENGIILATRDGGTTWTPQTSGTDEVLTSVTVLPDGLRGWAVGSGGTILATHDGGTTWTPQTSGTDSSLTSVTVLPDGQRGWALGVGGSIRTTRDGGATWTPQTSGTDEVLASVTVLPDGQHGWAVGMHGTILATRDGGTTWTPQTSSTIFSLNSITILLDGQRGWAVGSGGTILATRDSGATWAVQITGTDKILTSVTVLPDGQRSWTVGDSGTILTTHDGGATWTPQISGTDEVLTSVTVLPDGLRGWAVGSNGTILATRDGGATWTEKISGTKNWLTSISMLLDGQRGWAVGEHGTIIATSDGGTTWTAQTSGTNEWLSSVAILPGGQRGWAVGGRGTILTTHNGTTWLLIGYSRYPAPWFYPVVLLVLVALIMPPLRKPPRIEVPEEQRSVAEMLVSDRPLEPGDPDALDTHALAAGIARFFGNENTQPPLTLAITGTWGSGKSSIMNLVRADLKGYGFRSVWFNAWHHQTEEHILAALFDGLRRQALYASWDPRGYAFRLRLLWIRGVKNWLPIILLVMACAAVVAYLSTGPAALAGVPTGAVAAIVSLISIWRGASTFGVSPSVIAAAVSGRMHVGDLQANTGLRQRFGEIFRDVATALEPHRLVIFIDDLDRCRPENTLNVLEIINFLVSWGKCFIVLGIAREQVEGCVGLAFKDVAAQLAGDGELGSDSASGGERAILTKFARNYLDKLINIEVPVPPLVEEGSARLLVPDDSMALATTPPPWVRRQFRWLVPTTLGLLALLSVFVGSLLPGEATKLFGAPTTTPTATTTPAITRVLLLNGPSAQETAAPVTPTPTAAPKTTPTPHLTDPKQPTAGPTPGLIQPSRWSAPKWMYAIVSVLVVGFVGFGGYRLIQPPVKLEKDSPPFQNALLVWHRLVYQASRTPRAMKRFLNRARYLAMLQRPSTPQLTPSEHADADESIDEELLVALSAIQHAHPDWMEGEHSVWKDIDTFLSAHASELSDTMANSLRRSAPLERYQMRFETLTAGVTVR